MRGDLVGGCGRILVAAMRTSLATVTPWEKLMSNKALLVKMLISNEALFRKWLWLFPERALWHYMIRNFRSMGLKKVGGMQNPW